MLTMKSIEDMRRENLAVVVERRCNGSQTAASARLGYERPTLLNHWLAGRKKMSTPSARKIEEVFGLPLNWMDTEHDLESVDAVMSTPEGLVLVQSKTYTPDTLNQVTTTSTQRLKASLGSQGVKAETLASVTGVGVDVASQWLAGEGQEITLAQAVALQNTYGVNAVWLTKGKGEPGVAVRWNDEYRPIPITGWKPIPVVGMAQLGDNGHWSDLEYPVGHGDGYVDFPSRDPNAYALKCVGDSMRPRIRDGEFAIIEPGHAVEPGDDVLVKSKDGRVMIKTFLYKRAGRIHLISINEAHPSMSFADDEIEKMHYVVATTRPSMWRPG
jgi:phage repressor protein C with HTH and peptisase S24 domain